MNAFSEVYDEVAYVYDGSLEGLLSAIFQAYARHEEPSDVVSEGALQPRLGQRVCSIETDAALAHRVKRGIQRVAGRPAFRAVLKASLSGDPDAGSHAYRFVRYAMADGGKGSVNNIAHPAVAPLHAIVRAVNQECEHIRQFARFKHIRTDSADLWFARINPRDRVVPLVMDHFVERFNIQPFILYDEVHGMAGVYDGSTWYHVMPDTDVMLDREGACVEEVLMQDAWKRFYRSLSVDARYNPELRRQLMPKRFWRNLTEMQEDVDGLRCQGRS